MYSQSFIILKLQNYMWHLRWDVIIGLIFWFPLKNHVLYSRVLHADIYHWMCAHWIISHITLPIWWHQTVTSWDLCCQFTDRCTFTSQFCYLLTSIKWTTKIEFPRLLGHSTVDSFVEACPVSIILRISRGLCMWFHFTLLVREPQLLHRLHIFQIVSLEIC